MNYQVKFKLKGHHLFRTIGKVQGDLILTDGTPRRVLILEDETRIEVPMEGTIWEFSKERFLVIKKNMEKESGHDMKLNK